MTSRSAFISAHILSQDEAEIGRHLQSTCHAMGAYREQTVLPLDAPVVDPE